MTTNPTTPRLEEIEQADAATLRRIWAESKGSTPPKTFTARLMRLALAWDVQASNGSGEAAKVWRGWNRIIKEKVKGRTISQSGNAPAPFAGDGTRLLKDWRGTTHVVLVTEGGATWNDQSYSSLSAVARAMTGTNRNGPKFFGLREGGKQ